MNDKKIIKIFLILISLYISWHLGRFYQINKTQKTVRLILNNSKELNGKIEDKIIINQYGVKLLTDDLGGGYLNQQQLKN